MPRFEDFDGLVSIIFDRGTAGGPIVESISLAFSKIEIEAEVLPFGSFTLQRAEDGRVPPYTPEWTDFNTGDPGTTLPQAAPFDDLLLI